MSKDLVILIKRDDIRAALNDGRVQNMINWTPTDEEVDKCIEWMRQKYEEDYADRVYGFVDEVTAEGPVAS